MAEQVTDINAEFMREVMDWMDAHPQESDQGNYGRTDGTPCGTTFCIAGRACLLAGWEPIWVQEGERRVFGEPPSVMVDVRNPADGTDRMAYDLAAELFGLTNLEADRLFIRTASVKNLADLRGVVEDIIAHRRLTDALAADRPKETLDRST